MIPEIPKLPYPEWLSKLDVNAIEKGNLPLFDILAASVFYPASACDGGPVAQLGGNYYSFIYVDYGISRNRLDHEIVNEGFMGYSVLAMRPVRASELVPSGWQPKYHPKESIKYPIPPNTEAAYCQWIVFERKDNYSAEHGPKRFSLLYLYADGVATYQALFNSNNVCPAVIAIIQPGTGFGGNWTDFRAQDGALLRVVKDNPAGMPQFLLYGGIGGKKFYEETCWIEYSEFVAWLPWSGEQGNSTSIWRDDIY